MVQSGSRANGGEGGEGSYPEAEDGHLGAALEGHGRVVSELGHGEGFGERDDMVGGRKVHAALAMASAKLRGLWRWRCRSGGGGRVVAF